MLLSKSLLSILVKGIYLMKSNHNSRGGNTDYRGRYFDKHRQPLGPRAPRGPQEPQRPQGEGGSSGDGSSGNSNEDLVSSALAKIRARQSSLLPGSLRNSKIFRPLVGRYPDLEPNSDLTESEKCALVRSLSREDFAAVVPSNTPGGGFKVRSLNGTTRNSFEFLKLRQQGTIGDLVGLNREDS